MAGSFYPAVPAELGGMVRSFLEGGVEAARRVPADQRVFAIIVPHAGYVFSGAVAGWSYDALPKGTIRTAIVMGPNHRVRAEQAVTLDADVYRTPLGDVPIAKEVVQQLLRDGGGSLAVMPEVFRPEHSVDVQMPFIRTALPEARVVPLVVPHLATERLQALAALLAKVLSSDPGALLVASSDLSHYFPYETARRLDDQILQEIEASRTDALLAHAGERSGPCGVAPIVVALEVMKKLPGGKVVRLRYQNSGDTQGDRSRVVGYGALALTTPRDAG